MVMCSKERRKPECLFYYHQLVSVAVTLCTFGISSNSNIIFSLCLPLYGWESESSNLLAPRLRQCWMIYMECGYREKEKEEKKSMKTVSLAVARVRSTAFSRASQLPVCCVWLTSSSSCSIYTRGDRAGSREKREYKIWFITRHWLTHACIPTSNVYYVVLKSRMSTASSSHPTFIQLALEENAVL